MLRDACLALVIWARTNEAKVHIGELAIDAGENGRTTYCGTFATAQRQWADWNSFCLANIDVLVGWNWLAIGLLALLAALRAGTPRKLLALFLGASILVQTGLSLAMMGVFVGNELLAAAAALLLAGGLLLKEP